MTLDEAESLAKSFLAGGDSPPLHAATTTDLARAILRYAPVVRAAEAWADHPYQTDAAEAHNMEEADHVLFTAIATMRKEMG